jgi:hypothetical protein
MRRRGPHRNSPIRSKASWTRARRMLLRPNPRTIISPCLAIRSRRRCRNRKGERRQPVHRRSARRDNVVVAVGKQPATPSFSPRHPERLTGERINRHDVQQLLRTVKVDTALPRQVTQSHSRTSGSAYPHHPHAIPTGIELNLRDAHVRRVQDKCPGLFARPLGWTTDAAALIDALGDVQKSSR